ncbi:MAG: aldehyde ferredoxin oxidoreductase family protein [Candidatus Thorarchaeota archaeon]
MIENDYRGGLMVWNRKIAYIDLSTEKISIGQIPKGIRKKYVGGRGINMYLLYNHLPPKIDPLGPENVLLVGAGLLTGIPALGAGRSQISAKSPITGGIGDSSIGGFFGPEMKFAGFDHLVIRGKANSPRYVFLNDGEIELRDAAHLWGMDTFEAQNKIRTENEDEEIQALVIGVAGENKVRFANVRTGMKSAAGRTGMGAVMGSKNLKAIAARGTNSVEFVHPKELLKYCTEMNEKVMNSRWARAQSRWGTMIIYSNTNTTGLIRTKNFQLNKLEDGEDLEPENMDKFTTGMTACYGCQIACRHRYSVERKGYGIIKGEGPEYTSLGAFGTMMDVKQLDTVLVANHLVNQYGLDTLETGGILSWAFELYEKGILNKKMADGIELTWGNEEAMLEMIRRIAYREGLGDVLAKGFPSAIKEIGQNSDRYAIQVKGLSSLHSDERPTPSFALGIATATRGADHLRSRPAIDLYGLPENLLKEIYGGPVSSDYTSYEGKSRMVWWQELLYAITDSLGICKFQTVFLSVNSPKWEEFSKLLKYAAGLDLSKTQLMEAGERIYTIERLFNLREGFSRGDDTLPERFFTEPTQLGFPLVKGKVIDRSKFNTMLDEYYGLHGWNDQGIPTPNTLKQLSLDQEPTYII